MVLSSEDIISSPSHYRALRVDRFIRKPMRRFLLRIGLFLHILSMAGMVLVLVLRALSHTFLGGLLSFFASFDPFFLWSFFFIGASFFYFFLFLELFYLASSRAVRVLRYEGKDAMLSFSGADIFYELDLLRNTGTCSLFDAYMSLRKNAVFIFSCVRLGVPMSDVVSFIREERESLAKIPISRRSFLLRMAGGAAEEDAISLGVSSVVLALYDIDDRFRSFFFVKRIGREELAGVLRWVEEAFEDDHRRSMFWEKSRLGRTPGVAKDFGFGYTYTLDSHSRDIPISKHALSLASRKRLIDAVENILSKSGEANVLLVGEEGVGKDTVLEGIATRIFRGVVSPFLEYKRLVRLDIDGVIAGAKTKGVFEEQMLRILREVTSAGNIIIVFDDFPHALESAQKIGSDMVSITEKAFSGSSLQVIALADPYGYHKMLEPNGKIQSLFSKIEIEEPTEEETQIILQDIAPMIEHGSETIFSYQALARIGEIASRFIQTGSMPEKAINLADEVFTMYAKGDKAIIVSTDVDAFASQKLKIPLGEAETDEKDTLLRLEELLHERIINQEEAIRTIADTMRRARAGIRNQKRPIGSFLFLGPTGVGKTESAKALASVYFKGEDRMIRFDMSEFQGEEGIKKMIGSFDSSEPGVLATHVRDNPFALYLFDEIEKASREVMNLFLQILEEGFFSDSRGDRISMRETIMIATSNAGASQIWELIQQGKDPAEVKKDVIDLIQRDGIISPELLNRFDGIVIFHPLTKGQLEQVARLLLRELGARLEEKDITLEVSDALVKKVAEIGFNPTFGARPMRRAIADRIESYIAKKMLSGDLKRGDTVRFSEADIDAL
ncbi:MAG: AAA family ATPase [bacterium]|nr:AAA family ATPase [bacterium]